MVPIFVPEFIFKEWSEANFIIPEKEELQMELLRQLEEYLNAEVMNLPMHRKVREVLLARINALRAYSGLAPLSIPIDLSAKGLYELGKALGRVAQQRPDITHRFLLGMRDGLNEVQNGCGYGFGDVFSFLWRRAQHTLSMVLPIPFQSLLDQPSGKGKL